MGNAVMTDIVLHLLAAMAGGTVLPLGAMWFLMETYPRHGARLRVAVGQAGAVASLLL